MGVQKRVNKLLALGLAIAPLFGGCHQPSPATTRDTKPSVTRIPTDSTPVTDLGVVELVASTPKEIKVNGKIWMVTATPIANGNLAAVFQTFDFVDAKQEQASHKPGATVAKLNAIVPRDVAYQFYLGETPVSLTLRVKKE